MAEHTEDLVLRARNITQAAFAEVNKALGELEGRTKSVGDGGKSAGVSLSSAFSSMAGPVAMATAAIGATLAGVGLLAGAIVKLGIDGADVSDVTASFKGLNLTIGNDSVKVLGALKSSFAGTVSDFKLMEMSNVAMSAGLKGSVTTFGLLGDSARVLSDRGLGTAEEAFGTLSKAMATGKLKSAELLIGNIDAGRAYAEYAKEIGKAKDKLSESEKITATSIAIQQRLKESVMAGGKAQFDFGDAVKASGVMVTNFQKSLAMAVAESPVVNAMLKSFEKGLQGAFGVNQTQLVHSLIGYVDKFAIVLVDAALLGVRSTEFLYKGFSALQVPLHTAIVWVVKMGDAFAATTLSTLELASKIPGVGGAFAGLVENAKAVAANMHGLSEKYQLQLQATKDAAAGTDGFGKMLGGLKSALTNAREEMVKAVGTHVELKSSTDSSGKSAEDYGLTADAVSKANVKALKQEKDEWDKLIVAIQKHAKDATWTGEALAKGWFGPLETKIPETIGLTKEMRKELERMGEGSLSMGEALSQGLFGPITKDLEGLPPKVKSASQTAADSLGVMATAFTNLATIAGGSFANVVRSIGTVIAAMDLGAKAGSQMKSSWDQIGKGGTGNTIAGLAGMTTGVLGAAGAMAQATESGGTFTKTLGGMVTGAKIGTMIMPGLGTAFGAAAGAVIGFARGVFSASEELKELRKWNVEIDKIRDALLTTHGPLDGLELKAKAVGLSFKSEWGHQGKAGLDMFNTFIGTFDARMADVNAKFSDLFKIAATTGDVIPDHLKPVIDHLIEIGVLTKDNTILFGKLGEETDVDFRKMEDAAKRYGIDLADLGPKFASAKMHEAAKTIWDDFQMLKGGGADVDRVLWGMKDSIIKLATESLTFGGKIPGNFKPLIDSLLKSEELTEIERNALQVLGEEQFGPPIVDQFSKMISSIEELIRAIGGPLMDRINKIPTDRDLNVNIKYHDPGPPEMPELEAIVVSPPPGLPPPPPLDDIGFVVNYASGGIVNAGSGRIIRAHGREAIVPLDRPSAIGHQLIREIVAVSDRRGGDTSLRADMAEMQQAIRELAAMQAILPGQLARALRDSELQGRR